MEPVILLSSLHHIVCTRAATVLLFLILCVGHLHTVGPKHFPAPDLLSLTVARSLTLPLLECTYKELQCLSRSV